MNTDTKEKIVKIIAEYQDEAEGLGAISLGKSLYEIHNIPMFASGLYLFDVVRCREDEASNLKPVILEVITPSNYSTIGIIFSDTLNGEQQGDIVWDLYKAFKNFYYERATDTNCAISFPKVHFEEICQRLNVAYKLCLGYIRIRAISTNHREKYPHFSNKNRLGQNPLFKLNKFN